MKASKAAPYYEISAGHRRSGCVSARALRQARFHVIGSDITGGLDFLDEPPPSRGIRAIITNPPYALAREFIEHALHLDGVRVVAKLLGRASP